MLDLRYIIDNLDAVKENIKNRAMNAEADAVARLFRARSTLTTALQAAQQKRNANAAAMKQRPGAEAAPLDADARGALVEEGKKLKEEIAALEERLGALEAELEREAKKIPNMAHPHAPCGADDAANTELSRHGEIPRFDFTPKDHVALGQELDIIDFDTATKVSGAKFYYLKNEGVFLELGLIRYALDILARHGFSPLITPDIAREEILEGIGFNPRGTESNVYTLEDERACLVGTAEITLGGYFADTITPKEKLPLRLAGLSHCFRREAGAAGQFSKGLYRVHQFTKLEMFVCCLPEHSEGEHEKLRAIEEEIFDGLGIPFRVVETCTGDLGAPAYRKWDLEAWMPGRNGGEYGEITSTSNCTDYQARRLKARYKDCDGKNKFVHMLNGTAVAVSRALVAILENYQQADGSVRVPPALAPYCGFSVIRRGV
ncbi:MAG: serine--tRNA ligase [Spirochaetaceae bacterium]|jgi:seryl-tRNA synthetase|nr:serine--tRNA ligase [Spirochaetaceae bacterium]